MLSRMPTGLVVFAMERMSDAWREIDALVADHWSEIGPGEEPVSIDWPGYIKQNDAGSLVLLTVRAAGVLVGYATYWVGAHLMHASRKTAWNDAIYLTPEARVGNIGREFIAWVDRSFEQQGVHEVYLSTRSNTRDLGPILRRLDYQPAETVYARRLNVAEVPNG